MSKPIETREDFGIKTDEIFKAVNEASASAADQAKKDAESLAQNQEKARNEKLARRAAVLRENRKRATNGLIFRLALSAALAAFIIWTKEARWISPQIMPWELMLVSSYAAYCTGCWAMCMAIWKE